MTDGKSPLTPQVLAIMLLSLPEPMRANMLVACQDDQSEPEGGFDLNRQKTPARMPAFCLKFSAGL